MPELGSSAVMHKEGLDIGANPTKLLQKIEELTQYLIEQNEQLKEQNEKQELLQKELEA